MDVVPSSWQDSLSLGLTYSVAQISSYLPKILAALLVLIVGIIFAKIVRNVVARALGALRLSKVLEKTPVELFLKNDEIGNRLEDGVAGVVYWLLLFLVFHTTVSVLGLTPLSDLLDRVLLYIPHIFSALFIFILGVILAGVAETFVKGTLRSLDPHSARLFAKIASYLVVTVGGLAAVAELGIASQFILILFVGVVFAVSLGAGLALGLGGRNTVEKMLNNWQKQVEK
jgi:hypothetical protein